MKIPRRWLMVGLAVTAAAAAVLGAASTGRAGSSGASGSITVWVDAVRLPVAKLYVKTHPKVHVKIVTYDGDGNGATTMQTKIQLWNRTGHGWPDVIFTEQANDPVWMAQKPFDYAMDLKSVFPKNLLSGWPAPSLRQCARRQPPCLPAGQPGPGGALRQQEADEASSATPSRRRGSSGRRWARRWPPTIPATSSGTSATPTARGSTCGPTSARSRRSSAPNTVRINAGDVHCTRMAKLLDPLIKSGVVPPESVFTADFATKWGGENDKILLMPGPVWYAKDIFGGTLTSRRAS